MKETIQDITAELAKPNATIIIVQEGEKIVGAVWGFSYESPQQFIEEKYKADMQTIIEQTLRTNGIQEAFFYISECALLPTRDEKGQMKYRGKGITNSFMQTFVQEAQQLNLPAVMRTTMESPMNIVAQRFGMEQVFGPKVILNDRRSMRILEGTFVSGVDSQNPKRVLYAIDRMK